MRIPYVYRPLIIMSIAAALLAGVLAHAETKPPLTVAQALSMLQALRNLDGRQVIVKQNGVDTAITSPWDFGSGTLRMRIARNIRALEANEKAVDDSRLAIIKEITKNMPAAKNGGPPEIAPATPEWEAFQRQMTEVLNQPAQVDLSRIRVSELKLDKNEIPVTALSALAPILDDDLSSK